MRDAWPECVIRDPHWREAPGWSARETRPPFDANYLVRKLGMVFCANKKTAGEVAVCLQPVAVALRGKVTVLVIPAARNYPRRPGQMFHVRISEAPAGCWSNSVCGTRHRRGRLEVAR